MSNSAVANFIGNSRWSLAANFLTFSRFVGSPALALLVLQRNPWWVAFWFGIVLGLTDYLDGHFARRAEPTKFGAFLDPLADKLVVLLVGYAMVEIGRFSWIPITLIAIREVGIMVYRSYWARHGLAIPARPSAKYKAFVQALALAAAACPPLEPYPWLADGLLWLAVGFTWLTAGQYALDGRQALRASGAL